METCPSCSALVPHGARFCPACGEAQVRAGRGDERRVVTVVFADLVGFTTLSERRDPEQVKRLVDRVFARLAADVAAFGGRVDKIIGDGMVALFGAPVAHEDDAERAVRAALRMQHSVKDALGDVPVAVELRVGVNTGEVLVGGLRGGGDYTAMGDVVNSAQRLQTAAPPGGVFVGPATHAATVEVVAYQPVGEVFARGREEPIEAWLALEPLSRPGRRRRRYETPLVGRDDEVALLVDQLRLSAHRQRAVIALVEGEGGAGKSRLVAEVVGIARDELGATVLVGSSVPYGESNRWRPVASALHEALGFAWGADADEVRAALAGVLPSVTGRSEQDVASLTEALLHLFGHPSRLDGVDPARVRNDVLWAVLTVLQGMAAQGPVVLVLADLHWADQLVLDLLRNVLTRLAATPFAVVATARPELADPWPPTDAHLTTVVLRLGPLDPSAAGMLLRCILDDEPSPELMDELYQRSGGNPLFLEELGALVANGGGTTALPHSLRALVAARLDQLPAALRAMLDNAAVLGSNGSWGALRTFGEAMGQQPDRATFDGLVDAGLLDVDGDGWRFRSESVRDVAYRTITKADRARRHAGTAQALEAYHGPGSGCDELAHHWATAAELVDELGPVGGVPADVAARAVDALLHASEVALDDLYPAAAERYADRALALVRLDDAARRQRTILVRAGARVEQGDAAGAASDLADVLPVVRAGNDPEMLATALQVQAEIDRVQLRFDDAEVALAEAAELWSGLGHDLRLAEVERARGMVALFQGSYDAADHHLDAADALYRRLGDRRGTAWVDQHRAWVSFVRGDIDEADRRLQAAAETMTALGDRGGLGWVMGLLAYVRFFQGRLDEAEQLGATVEREAGERGERWAEAMMATLRASLCLWTGRVVDSARLAGQALETFRAIDDRFGVEQALLVQARALLSMGRIGDANRLAEEAIRSSAPANNAIAEAVGAAIALFQGDIARGEALARGAAVEAVDAGASHYEALVLHGLARMLGGAPAEALDSLDQAADLRPGHPNALAVMALATAAVGRGAEARRLAERAVQAEGVTYLDRLMAGIAGAMADLQLGLGPQALAGLAAQRDALDATDDVLGALLAHTAHAVALRCLGDPAAEAAQREVGMRRDLLGVRLAPWESLFEAAARGVPVG